MRVVCPGSWADSTAQRLYVHNCKTHAVYIANKSSVEHIPRAQPRSCTLLDSCMLLDICLYVVYMFVLPIYLHAQEMHYQQFSILQKEKSSAVVVIFAAIVCILTCLFVTLSSLICSCHREY